MDEHKDVIDPTAFLFTIKPEMAYITFKSETKQIAFEIGSSWGPLFGAGWDICVMDEPSCTQNKSNHASPWTFEFKGSQMSPGNSGSFNIKEYEIFSVNIP